MKYRHTQTTFVALVVLDIVVVVTILVMIASGAPATPIVVTVAAFAAIAALVATFSRLTVVVDRDGIRAAFGWGWPRRSISLADVAAAHPVRNPWWYGWGLRKVRRGWMYNVWGLDAVELVLAHGRVFRVGTDEPDELIDALRVATAGRLGVATPAG